MKRSTVVEDINSEKRTGDVLLRLLSDGRALTAIELSQKSGINPGEVRTSLTGLVNKKIIEKEQHRHIYYKMTRGAISTDEILDLLKKSIADKEVRPFIYCRSCYGHLAGKTGALLTQKMVADEILTPPSVETAEEFGITPKGYEFFADLGIDAGHLKAVACLDFSERYHHLGGPLGAALLSVMIAKGWLLREGSTRALVPTTEGIAAINTIWKLNL